MGEKPPEAKQIETGLTGDDVALVIGQQRLEILGLQKVNRQLDIYVKELEADAEKPEEGE